MKLSHHPGPPRARRRRREGDYLDLVNSSWWFNFKKLARSSRLTSILLSESYYFEDSKLTNMGLPWELVIEIIQLVLHDVPRRPTPLILVNSAFRNLCLSILHTELRFRSVQQLDEFTKSTTTLVSHPLNMSITLAGGTADYRLFKLMRGVFQHCLSLLGEHPPTAQTRYSETYAATPRLQLQRIYFCLNSHTLDDNCRYLQDALCLTE